MEGAERNKMRPVGRAQEVRDRKVIPPCLIRKIQPSARNAVLF